MRNPPSATAEASSTSRPAAMTSGPMPSPPMAAILWTRMKPPACLRTLSPLCRHAPLVFVRARVDLDPVARGAEGRHLDLESRRELGGLENLARRVAAHRGLGVLHLADDRGRQLEGDGAPFVEEGFARHAVLDVVHRVAEVVLLDVDLVVLAVHEAIHRIGEV